MPNELKWTCKYYHTQKKLKYTYNPITGSPIPHDIDVGVCWGTKETDECSCGGDETKCDFYPEVRKKARATQNKLKPCACCTNKNGKTDLSFSIIDDDLGQYAKESLIKYCPFCGRELEVDNGKRA